MAAITSILSKSLEQAEYALQELHSYCLSEGFALAMMGQGRVDGSLKRTPQVGIFAGIPIYLVLFVLASFLGLFHGFKILVL